MKTLRSLLLSSVLPALLAHGMIGTATADARVGQAADGTTYFSDRLAPSAGAPVAVTSERAAVTAGRMGGRWLAQSEDGSLTVLELRPSGGFMFDQQAQRTPERSYMCGDWALAGGELSLVAKTRKTRRASGEIELSENESRQTYTVLAARSDVLVLRDEGRTLTFYRRGA